MKKFFFMVPCSGTFTCTAGVEVEAKTEAEARQLIEEDGPDTFMVDTYHEEQHGLEAVGEPELQEDGE